MYSCIIKTINPENDINMCVASLYKAIEFANMYIGLRPQYSINQISILKEDSPFIELRVVK